MLHQSALAAVGSSYELFSKLRRSQCLCSRSSKWHFPKSCLLSSPICPTIKFWKMTTSFCITRGKPWRQVASRTPSGCDSYQTLLNISKLPKFRGATNEVCAIVLEYGRKTVQRFVPLSSPTSPHFTHTSFYFFRHTRTLSGDNASTLPRLRMLQCFATIDGCRTLAVQCNGDVHLITWWNPRDETNWLSVSSRNLDPGNDCITGS